jgi:hypothetical protein
VFPLPLVTIRESPRSRRGDGLHSRPDTTAERSVGSGQLRRRWRRAGEARPATSPDMEALTLAIGWGTLVLGLVSIILGLYLMWKHRTTPDELKGIQESAALEGVADVVNSVSDFAKAIKELDRGTQALTVGVLLIAISALVAGLDSIADAIESISD